MIDFRRFKVELRKDDILTENINFSNPLINLFAFLELP